MDAAAPREPQLATTTTSSDHLRVAAHLGAPPTTKEGQHNNPKNGAYIIYI